jgi:hypothetical protein
LVADGKCVAIYAYSMRGIGEGFEVLKSAAIPANGLPNLGIGVRFVLLLQAGDYRDEDPDFQWSGMFEVE